MGRKYRNSALFKRYLAFNLCFVLVPVLVIVAVYGLSIFNRIIRELETAHRNSLTQVMRTVDSNLETMSLMASQLSNDSDLTPYQLQKTEYGRYKAINRLRIYHSQSGFLDEMVLVIRGDATVYSNEGVMSMDFFLNDLHRFVGDWDGDDFEALVHGTSKYAFSPAGCFLEETGLDPIRKAILVVPWENVAGRFGSILGLVNASYFEGLLREIKSGIDARFLILDPSGRALFDSMKGEVPWPETWISEGSGDRAGTIRIGGTRYSAVSIRSRLNGWIYVALFPGSRFLTQVSRVEPWAIVLVVGILLVSVTFGILLALGNYLPIRRLNLTIGQGVHGVDEIDEIDKSIRLLMARSEGMRQELDETRLEAAERHLHSVLDGNGSAAGLAKRLRELGLALDQESFCVLVCRPPAKMTAEERALATSVLKSVDWDPGIFCVEMDCDNSCAVLVNHGEGRHPLREAVRLVHEALDHTSRNAYSVGVGRSYPSLDTIGRSFSEAVTALESSGSDTPVYFDDIPAQKRSGPYWYPAKSQLGLVQGLSQGNVALVEESLSELAVFLRGVRRGSDDLGERFVVAGIVHDLVPIVERFKKEGGHEAIDELVHYHGIPDFLNRLAGLASEILDLVELGKTRERKVLYLKILSYLEEHFADSGLCLKSLAFEFDMTESYLSRFFRGNSGINFIDYVSEKRMALASRLLKDTDLKVREIMEKVGYSDLPSFTRKFKQVFTMSPGNYRSVPDVPGDHGTS